MARDSKKLMKLVGGITPENLHGGDQTLCLDCGAEFHYDFAQMRRGEKRSRRVSYRPNQYDGRMVERLIHTVDAARND